MLPPSVWLKPKAPVLKLPKNLVVPSFRMAKTISVPPFSISKTSLVPLLFYNSPLPVINDLYSVTKKIILLTVTGLSGLRAGDEILKWLSAQT